LTDNDRLWPEGKKVGSLESGGREYSKLMVALGRASGYQSPIYGIHTA
jgi:hypothetical protein